MLKRKKTIIEILILITILSISLIITNALYKGEKKGQANLSVASPKIRLINETTHIEELDFEIYSNDFKVVNYDENGDVTEIALNYILLFDMTNEDAPIDMKLYKIEENGSETEVTLDKNLETVPESFETGEKQKNNYRLKMWFNLETGHMDENVDLNINLKAIQVQPN